MPKPKCGGQQLAERLAELEWTQTDLSERLNVSTGAVSRWLSGERTPSLRLAIKLERELGIPHDAWTEPPHKGAA